MSTAEHTKPGPFREVLRGAERDAAVSAAAAWIIDQGNPSLDEIGDRFQISLTASAEARLLAGRLQDGGASASDKAG